MKGGNKKMGTIQEKSLEVLEAQKVLLQKEYELRLMQMEDQIAMLKQGKVQP